MHVYFIHKKITLREVVSVASDIMVAIIMLPSTPLLKNIS